MYRDVDLYAKVRRAVMVENQSERGAAKRFGISRKTVSKMVRHAVPPGYRRKEAPVSPKLGPFVSRTPKGVRYWSTSGLGDRLPHSRGLDRGSRKPKPAEAGSGGANELSQ